MAMNDPAFKRIYQEIAENEVVLYMKGAAVFPQDGFSAAVVQVLETLGVRYRDVDVLLDPGLHNALKEFANWPMVPQLYIKGEFVGGCDVVREMHQSGELQRLLTEKQISFLA